MNPSPENSRPESGNMVAAAAAIVCVAVFACASSLILPVLTLSMEARGNTSVTIGVFGAMLGLAAIVVTFFVPAAVRRFGARWVLLISLWVITIATLCYKPLEESLAAWFSIYIIYSAALGFMFVVSESVITTAAPAARRNLILGLYATGFSAGFALGPFVLLQTGVEGWPPFLAGASFSLAASLLVFFGIRGDATPSPKAVDARKMAGYFLGMAKLLPLPFAAAVTVGAMEMTVYDFLPVYAKKTGYDINGAVLLLSAFSVGALLIVPIVGALADKYRSRLVLFWVIILAALGAATLPLLVLGAQEGIWFYWICLGIWGGMIMALYSLGLVQMAHALPRGDLVGGNSLFGLSYGIGAFSGPLLSGAAMDIQVHAIAAVLTIFAILPLLFWRKRTPQI